MPTQTDRTAGELDWPPWADRTPAGNRTRTSKFSVTLHSAISDVVDCVRTLRDAALEAEDELQEIRWVAAGGRGHGSLEELQRLGEAMERTAKALQEEAEDAPDPFEVEIDAE